VEETITSKVSRFTIPPTFPLGSYAVTIFHQWGVTTETVIVTD
jgi:hypothetical protein